MLPEFNLSTFFFKPNHFLSNKPGHLIEIKIGIRPTTEEKEVFDEMENWGVMIQDATKNWGKFNIGKEVTL